MILARFIITFFALSTGSIASAASIQNIEVQLDYNGDSYFDFEIVNAATGLVVEHVDELFDPENMLGLPTLFPFDINERIGFTAEIDDAFGLTRCNLGGYDCALNAKVESVVANTIDIFYGPAEGLNNGRLFGGLLTGDLLRFDFLQFMTVGFGSDYFGRWSVQRASFTVAEGVPQPAPVPLPASALLLGAACTAMGAMRRRQNRLTA